MSGASRGAGRRRSLGQGALRALLYLLVAAVLVFTVFPFVWAFVSSIKPDDELFTTPVRYWPGRATLDNYRLVLANGEFQTALLNSVIVAVSVTAVSLAVGSLAAYALGRFRFRGRSLVLYVVLGMTIFPQIAVLGALFQMINFLNLYNQLPALILTYLIFTLPFTVWVLTGFMKAIPREIEEAAYVDGATHWQVFTQIMLPLSVPGMATTGILAFIAAWNEFLFALSFTQTPDKRTVTYAIQAFSTTSSGLYEIPWGQTMAASIVVTVPLVVLTLVFQRRILAGLTAGAVKG
ncbi:MULTISPECIES: carbohydrate ABC transporter permease [Sorangium]|uniref:Trehalose/maltose transport system, permease protein n=1 Tax=Sorangium cellulosum (strain So ce56) TaxID=448385 RepID=A9FLC9_SORC5|nr:carbohydrate ABC transporter permease [Sorangium cellulosum]CAN95202.1 Trehalose/maltose transport system, permease protein [Sorangium cellulosum So ce56]